MSGKALTDGEYRELMACLFEGVPNRDQLNPDVVRAHLSNKAASHSAVAVLLSKPPQVTEDIYPITVDYSLTLEQMIVAGAYDWVNSAITPKNFPVKGKGIVILDAQFIYFGCSMSSDAIIAELDKIGLRPATHAELLAFGAKYPELQRQFLSVALGSVGEVGGGRFVVYLWRHADERRLNLDCFAYYWFGYCRFLAVRK